MAGLDTPATGPTKKRPRELANTLADLLSPR